MSARIRRHIRSNVVGYLSLFVALSGTAYAVDGPLPGQDQVGSEDIINAEVKAPDLGNNAVRSAEVAADTLGAEDIATGGISSSEILNSTLTDFDLGSDSVGWAELDPIAFNSEIAEIAPGFVFGIADDSIHTNEVAADALTGSDIHEASLDIDEASLAPSIDAVHAAGPDLSFGSPITSTDLQNPTNVITDNLNAGTWIVFAELGIYNEDDAATKVYCGIWTDDTQREISGKNIEAQFDDSNYDIEMSLTAAFTTTSPTTLRLACFNDTGGDGILRPLSPNLVAIPVASLG